VQHPPPAKQIASRSGQGVNKQPLPLAGVRYGALAVESGGAGPKEGPLEV
jgi:hypothetical protein